MAEPAGSQPQPSPQAAPVLVHRRPPPGTPDQGQAPVAYPDIMAGSPYPGYNQWGSGGTSFSPFSLLRWKGTIFLVFLGVCLLSLPVIWLKVQPQYASTAVVRYDSYVQPIRSRAGDTGAAHMYPVQVNTQATLVTCPEVLSRVLDRQDVQGTAWYRALTGAMEEPGPIPIEKLQRCLEVQPRRNTELIDVVMTSEFPVDTATIANAVVDEYYKYWQALRVQWQDDHVDKLRANLSALNHQVDLLFKKKHRLEAEIGNRLEPDMQDRLRLELEALEAERDELEQAIAQTDSAAQNPTASRPPVNSKSTIFDYRSDPRWIEAEETLQKARSEFSQAQAAGNLGPLNPRYRALSKAVEQAGEHLRSIEADFSPASSAADEATPEVRLAAVRADIDKRAAELTELNKLKQDFDKASEDYDVQKQQRNDTEARLSDVELEGNAPNRVTIHEHARVPRKPALDRRLPFTAVAIAAAFMLAFGAAFVRERTDVTIREAPDISTCTADGVPFLGALPRARDALRAAPDSPIGVAIHESMRMVRTALLQRLRLRGGNTVLITSPEPSTGKTSVSILLARSLAQMGKRVLVIDTDFAHPSATYFFQMQTRPGLRSLLGQLATDNQVIFNSETQGIDVLPVGPAVPLANMEPLANGEFAAGIARWKKRYDFVLLDSPPMLSMADARIAAGHADGAIMVLRASRSRRSDAIEAFAGLAASGADLLGTILVGLSQPSAYYGYSYQYGGRKKSTDLLA